MATKVRIFPYPQFNYIYKHMGAEVFYNKRDWLNPLSSPSTGSIVCYDGIDYLNKKENETYRNTFISITDCYSAARLHPIQGETNAQFIEKLEAICSNLQEFIAHLKTTPERE